MTGPTNSGNEVAALGTSFDMGGGMGGGEATGFGGADVLPFTGISTIPLALAGLVAAVVGSVVTRVGRKQPAPATLD